VRNKRDNRFYPGSKPAGSAGITKKTLHFLQTYLNPLAFRLQGKRPKPSGGQEEEEAALLMMKFENDMFDLFRHPPDYP
jgi:hypothetical protein